VVPPSAPVPWGLSFFARDRSKKRVVIIVLACYAVYVNLSADVTDVAQELESPSIPEPPTTLISTVPAELAFGDVTQIVVPSMELLKVMILVFPK
jgi:hypothetical protein